VFGADRNRVHIPSRRKLLNANISINRAADGDIGFGRAIAERWSTTTRCRRHPTMLGQ